ncbi:TaqI-like C-terminal specificity domain-containing protein [Ligilactobacillus agilis]|uniref:TaqI-like C-terminal specificity domain-containing protein n=1 Tax=Ligilactobacillus agilis TaxID=1601 RepID=UPI0022E1C17C|nr:TaqI-like C-terminal specificity domain-containing protein [Ligilactobacillus agilis]
MSEIEQSIKKKIEAVGTPLKDWDIKINRGILTGLNEAFIISKEKRDELIKADPKSAEIIRPILRGRDIKKNSYEFANIYVITAYKGINKIIKKEYPAIYLHLKKYEKKLRQRGQVEGKPGKPGSNQHHWTELDNNVSLEKLDDFSKQKILYSEIVTRPQFYFDSSGRFMPEATAFLITGSNIGTLIKYLNSKTISWIFKNYYAGGGLGNGFRYKKAFMEQLCVPSEILTEVVDEKIEDEILQIYKFNNDEKRYIKSLI